MNDVAVKCEMEQMIVDVGLPHKAKELSKNLSGALKAIVLPDLLNRCLVKFFETRMGGQVHTRRDPYGALF